MGAVLREAGQRETVWDEHEAIAKAIAAGDGDKAARLIEQHSRRASDNLARQLTQVLKGDLV
jgi:DNA-binding GntR family transcriptional regulator